MTEINLVRDAEHRFRHGQAVKASAPKPERIVVNASKRTGEPDDAYPAGWLPEVQAQRQRAARLAAQAKGDDTPGVHRRYPVRWIH